MMMISAIYEAGVLRPLRGLKLPNHQRVLIALFPAEDEVSSFLVAEAATQGKSFDFLAEPAEDLYQPTDGEPL